MHIIILLLIAGAYLIAAYLPFHQLLFIQQYQTVVDIGTVFGKLSYCSLALTVLGAIILLLIYKIFLPKQINKDFITASKFAVLVGIAASVLTLAISAGYNYGLLSSISKPAPWSQQELEYIAVHEAGHIIIREQEFPGSTVKAEIVPTSDISKTHYWFSQGLPNGFVQGNTSLRLATKEDINKTIKIYLAGLAAEKIVYSDKKQYLSASDDLEKVKQLVIKLCNHGLSPAGPVPWDALNENEKAALYQEVVMPLYYSVVETLQNHKEEVIALSEQLKEKRVLTGTEARRILKK